MNSAQILVALISVCKREVVRIMRIWTQTILPPAITMSLYYVVFGNLIGSRIGEVSGYAYITFIVPGLIMMSVITNSYANVSSSFFSSKFMRNIEEVLVSPTPHWVIVAGYTFGGVFRGLLVAVVVLIISLLFSPVIIRHPFVLTAMILSASVLFSLGGIVNGLYAEKFDDVAIIPTFVLTPLTYLGGVFYSVEMLPPLWKTISFFNPILYIVNVFRYGFLGQSDVPVFTAFFFTLIVIVILFFWALYLLRKGKAIRS